MMKLPFQIVLDRVFQIINLRLYVKSFELEFLLGEELNLFLKESGWSESEFDVELLHFIDENWKSFLN